MRRSSLNLASKGFANERPYRRAAVVLAVVGLVLLGVNAFLYGRYQAGSAEIRRQLREIEANIEGELLAVQKLETALSQMDLEIQNEQVAFLNDRIGERTFPWSQLFDRLAEVLPQEVRLSSLNPVSGSRGRRQRPRSGDGSVLLGISGEAKNDEALIAFVDSLFSHPSFGDPNLSQESRDVGSLRFQLQARYLPEGGVPSAPEATAPPVEVADVVSPAPAGEETSAVPVGDSNAPSSGTTAGVQPDRGAVAAGGPTVVPGSEAAIPGGVATAVGDAATTPGTPTTHPKEAATPRDSRPDSSLATAQPGAADPSGPGGGGADEPDRGRSAARTPATVGETAVSPTVSRPGGQSPMRPSDRRGANPTRPGSTDPRGPTPVPRSPSSASAPPRLRGGN